MSEQIDATQNDQPTQDSLYPQGWDGSYYKGLTLEVIEKVNGVKWTLSVVANGNWDADAGEGEFINAETGKIYTWNATQLASRLKDPDKFTKLSANQKVQM